MTMLLRALLLLCLSICSLRAAAGRPINFVIVLVDDLGWSELGVQGADLHQTPNIDRFASTALRFTDAYAAAPVCTPTRASIMTGKCPARLNMTIWREAAQEPQRGRKLIPPRVRDALPHEEVTIAEVLHDAGYLTAHIGKWHLGTAGFYPETQGFDINIGGTLWGAPQSFFFPYSGDRYFREPRYVPGLHNGKPGDYLTDALTSEALKVIDRDGSAPFFLNLCYHTVHTPIEGKPELVKKYDALRTHEMHHQNTELAAMVQSLDENVGRILAKLDERGLSENTVIIFTSDNGGFVNEFAGKTVTNNHPLRSGKGSLYEGGVRVPLIIRWPGVTTPGATTDEPVSTIDFYPTMLEIANLPGNSEHNANVDGISLTPLLRNPESTLGREALYFHYPHYYQTTSPVGAIRAGSWKLLEYYEDGHTELYNLTSDLSESHNLSESNPTKTTELRTKLTTWRTSVKAAAPTPAP